jgi:2-aminoadipate transaminase
LKLAARPEVISFAGGLPSPEGFPVEAIEKACQEVLETQGKQALQYSMVEGEMLLREQIARRETMKGIPTTADQIYIVSGSQQALDLLGRVFLDPGDKVLVESPTYMGALQAFDLEGPQYVELNCDEKGLNPAAFGEECRGAKFAYVMPTAANPTGLTIDEERRALLAQKAREYDMWLVEDDPYGELWYEVEPPKSLRYWAPERTIRLGTLSKILAPGFRLGYVIAPPEVLDKFASMKQAMDLCTAAFTQRVAGQAFSDDVLVEHLPSVRARYAKHAHAMLDALAEFMPEGVTWTKPIGGMFIWVTLPKHMNATTLMEHVLAENVAYVPGEPFYANKPEVNHFRLSFVTVDPEVIREGVRRLAGVIKAHI